MSARGARPSRRPVVRAPRVRLLYVHAHSRLEANLESATPQEGKQLEKEIDERLKKALSQKGDTELRAFIAVVGVDHAAGRAARVELAGRLVGRIELTGQLAPGREF